MIDRPWRQKDKISRGKHITPPKLHATILNACTLYHTITTQFVHTLLFALIICIARLLLVSFR